MLVQKDTRVVYVGTHDDGNNEQTGLVGSYRPKLDSVKANQNDDYGVQSNVNELCFIKVSLARKAK